MSVIKIENLWKEYRLGVIGHGTLTHDLQAWWAGIRGKDDPNSKIGSRFAGQEKQIDGDRFWALRDINLDVKQGEILGIIGSNGAGKSTLLKILSRVTAPTKGNIKVAGRIASLLEVGTGFHPELTGRENIFMNGAILGMSKHEIKSKLEEIIDFSGVEDFVDTPVKRYSSGMYVRLAFSVAAHLEPEILIVDEVLAVGDAEFQEKCLSKMQSVADHGRTILFVSHNLPMIEHLCKNTVLLANGKLVAEGKTADMIGKYRYLNKTAAITKDSVDREYVTTRGKDFTGYGQARFTGIGIIDTEGNERFVYKNDEEIAFHLSYEVYKEVQKLYFQISILKEDASGINIVSLTSLNHEIVDADCLKPGSKGTVIIKFSSKLFIPGVYPLYFWLAEGYGSECDIVNRLTNPITIQGDTDLLKQGGCIKIDSHMEHIVGTY